MAFPQIDWSKVPTTPSTPKYPEIDWGKVPSAPQPIAPIATAPPQIDWSKVPKSEPIQPIKPMVNLPQVGRSIGQAAVDKGKELLGTAGSVIGGTMYAGRDMLNAVDEWRHTPWFPESEKKIIDSAKKFGPKTGRLAEFAVKGITNPFGPGPVERTAKTENFDKFTDWATTTSDPTLLKAEQAPGEFVGKTPLVGPFAKKAVDFVTEGSFSPTGIAGMATTAIGGKIAAPLVVKYLPKVSKNISKVMQGTQKLARTLTPLELRFVEEVKGAKSLAHMKDELVSKEMSKRVQAMNKVNTKDLGMAGHAAQTAKLKGGLPTIPYESISSKFNDKEVKTLFNTIDASDLKPLDKVSAKQGLITMLNADLAGVPETSELKFLQHVFPGLKTPQAETNLMTSAGNISRTLSAGGDITSFPLRQGATLQTRKKFWEAIPKGIKGGIDEKYYRETMDGPLIKGSKHYGLGQDYAGLDITDLDDLVKHEEDAASAWAASLPGIRHSARAYSLNANVLRQPLFDEFIDKYSKMKDVSGKALYQLDPTKKNFDHKLVKDLGDYLNAATGRGKLGMFEGHAKALNAWFFSPRLASSRMSLMRRALVDPLKAPANVALKAMGRTPYERIHPQVRKEAWRDMIGFASVQMATLAAANTAKNIGLNDIEIGNEPTSSDWGKLKLGDNTRLDFNGGFQPYMRLIAQIAQQAQTSSVSGKRTEFEEGFKPEDTHTVILKMLQSKESPMAAFWTDFLRGEDLVGADVNLSREMRTKLTPIIIQDIVSLLEEDPSLLPLMIPANFGASLQVYGPEDIKKQPRKSKLNVTIPQPTIPKVRF